MSLKKWSFEIFGISNMCMLKQSLISVKDYFYEHVLVKSSSGRGGSGFTISEIKRKCHSPKCVLLVSTVVLYGIQQSRVYVRNCQCSRHSDYIQGVKLKSRLFWTYPTVHILKHFFLNHHSNWSLGVSIWYFELLLIKDHHMLLLVGILSQWLVYSLVS